jgi:predicted RNA-binding protein YlxR (DUF448 family)
LLARVEREESGAERTCVVTGETGSPETMLRFALSPEGVVTPDLRRKLPGRGVWTKLDARVVARAAKGFAKGFRQSVTASPTISDDIDALLVEDALQFLGLVNKSGSLVAGNAKVESAIRSGRAKALLHASEAKPDGVRKLDGLARGLDKPIASINLFETARLDLALGRTNVIHAALHAGPSSAAFLARVARLIAYRSGAHVQSGVDAGTTAQVATVSNVADERKSDSRDEI